MAKKKVASKRVAEARIGGFTHFQLTVIFAVFIVFVIFFLL